MDRRRPQRPVPGGTWGSSLPERRVWGRPWRSGAWQTQKAPLALAVLVPRQEHGVFPESQLPAGPWLSAPSQSLRCGDMKGSRHSWGAGHPQLSRGCCTPSTEQSVTRSQVWRPCYLRPRHHLAGPSDLPVRGEHSAPPTEVPQITQVTARAWCHRAHDWGAEAGTPKAEPTLELEVPGLHQGTRG